MELDCHGFLSLNQTFFQVHLDLDMGVEYFILYTLQQKSEQTKEYFCNKYHPYETFQSDIDRFVTDHINEVIHQTISGLNGKYKPGAALVQQFIQTHTYRTQLTLDLTKENIHVHPQATQCWHTPFFNWISTSHEDALVAPVTEQSTFLKGREEYARLPDMWDEFMTADSGPVAPNPSTVYLLALKWIFDVSHVSEDRGAISRTRLNSSEFQFFCKKKNVGELKICF